MVEFEDRFRLETQREGISRDEARYVLKKDDHKRRQWGLRLFGVDTWDANLYALVIHIHKMTVEDAVDMICNTTKLEHLRTTAESEAVVDNLVLAARIKAALVDTCPSVTVRATDRTVYVDTQAGPTVAEHLGKELRILAEQVPSVKEVRIDVTPTAAFLSD